jgi:hypothetical protein
MAAAIKTPKTRQVNGSRVHAGIPHHLLLDVPDQQEPDQGDRGRSFQGPAALGFDHGPDP